jgi:acyl dehydratase
MEIIRQSSSLPQLADAANRYFEDYVPGSIHEYGAICVEESDLIGFGRCYAPYKCHTDAAKAAQGPHGGLVASEAQAAAIMMRLLVDNFLSTVASIASPGFDELRCYRSVRPGDVLSIRVTALKARRSVSKPDQGTVWDQVELLNQDREVVLSLTTIGMLRCRPKTSESNRP